jgi:urea transport system substrate-binding protein
MMNHYTDKETVSRRTVLKTLGLTTAAAVTGLGFPAILKAADTITIGAPLPMTGAVAVNGPLLKNALEMAVAEINALGGIGGRKLEFILEDTQSATKGTIDSVRKLVHKNKVDVIIGTVLSLERQAALSVTGRAKKLFLYPDTYEGGECHPYLVCVGTIPNQQIDPLAPWLTNNIGKTLYFVGSDYIWGRNMGEALKTAFEAQGGSVLGWNFSPSVPGSSARRSSESARLSPTSCGIVLSEETLSALRGSIATLR